MKLIAVFLSLIMGGYQLRPAEAHCPRCARRIVRPRVKKPRVKIIKLRQNKVYPAYAITNYSPIVQGATVIVPPPVIRVGGPTIVQPPAVTIESSRVTAATSARVTSAARVTGTAVVGEQALVRPPMVQEQPCAEYIALLQKFKVAIDQCEVRERAMAARMAEYEKRLGIKRPPPREMPEKPEEKGEAKKTVGALARRVGVFIEKKCLACHAPDRIAAAGTKYAIDLDNLTRNDLLRMSSKVDAGDMPKQPNKYNIPDATEAEKDDLAKLAELTK